MEFTIYPITVNNFLNVKIINYFGMGDFTSFCYSNICTWMEMGTGGGRVVLGLGDLRTSKISTVMSDS